MSPSVTINTGFDVVLPYSVISYDRSPDLNRPEMITLCYDNDEMMIFLNVEDYMELAVWVSMKELVLYARHMKIDGHWTSKHCDQLDGVFETIQSGEAFEGALMIYDGELNGFIPFTQFLWLHSNKYHRGDDGYHVVEREGNHVDNGVAVMTDHGEVQVLDMFADGTAFYPADAHASCEAIESDNDSISTVDSGEVAMALMDLNFIKKNFV